MSISRLFTVIGDGNVRRNMTGLNSASRDSMKNAQVIPCEALGDLANSLSKVRAESNVVIIASITEMLLTAEDCGTLSSTCDTMFSLFKDRVSDFCHQKPGVSVIVAPLLYRHRPFWYQKHLHHFALRFSNIMSESRPANMHLLPSFASQDLMPDGVFLTPVSGLHYVLHLFDQTEAVLVNQASSSEVQLVDVKESCRSNSDRLAYLEHRHERVDDRLDLKVAADAEFNDWVLNRSEEDWFMLQGAPRLPESTPREWQLAAKRQVNDIIKLVLHSHRVRLDYTVVYVANPKRGINTGPTVSNVRLDSVSASKRIRDLFSGFFQRGVSAKLPSALKGISIRNKVTHETRVRIAILRQLGINYQEKNPGGSYQVRGYDSRPVLVTIPPSSSSGPDSRRRTFNFIDAVTTLPRELSDDNLVYIHQVINTKFVGQLQSLFVILQDDDRSRIDLLVRQRRDRSQRSVAFSLPQTSSGTVNGPGSGMDLQAALSLPPPPPPPPTVPPAPGEVDLVHCFFTFNFSLSPTVTFSKATRSVFGKSFL